ncbi:MAG: hypothetical protein HYY16_16990 [Planctomycetes bacterium]|nr:hypothetical protein [Planctomycetota bacterium]
MVVDTLSALARFFGSRDDVPDWAKFFPSESYLAFVTALAEDMHRRKARFELADGIVAVRRRGRARQEFGLQNLAQFCHQMPREEWASIIARHFDTLFHIDAQAARLDRLAENFERVRSCLKIRLYPSDMRGLDFVVRRESAPGLTAVLVYDLPNSVATVHPDSVKKWHRPIEELFRLGLENVRAEGALRRDVTEIDKGAAVISLVGETFFAASHALLLEDYLKPPPRCGALVGVPNRHTVLYHLIEDFRVLPAIKALLVATFSMFQEGPGSVSPNLYWWRDGALTLLPSIVRPKTIDFAPPMEFVEMLSGLGPSLCDSA